MKEEMRTHGWEESRHSCPEDNVLFLLVSLLGERESMICHSGLALTQDGSGNHCHLTGSLLYSHEDRSLHPGETNPLWLEAQVTSQQGCVFGQ